MPWVLIGKVQPRKYWNIRHKTSAGLDGVLLIQLGREVKLYINMMEVRGDI